MFAATEGNLSCRLDGGRVLCTPSLCEKGCLDVAELCTVDLSGAPVSGSRPPTSEIQLHLEIYRHCPDCAAVIHCHPPYATAIAVSHRPLPSGVLAEAEYYLGHIPVIPYRPPGSRALAEQLIPYIGECRCAILKNHGAVSWDRDLTRARWWMEVLDGYCRTLILAGQYGALAQLSGAEVAELRRKGRTL